MRPPDQLDNVPDMKGEDDSTHIYIQPKFYEDIQLDDERSKPIQQRLGLTRIYAFCRENISVANYAFLG